MGECGAAFVEKNYVDVRSHLENSAEDIGGDMRERLVCNGSQMVEIVLGWKIDQFSNGKLLDRYLTKLPKVYSTGGDFYSMQTPFVLEEIRHRISQSIEKFDEIEKYDAIVLGDKKAKNKSDGCLDVHIVVQATKPEEVKRSMYSFALLVESDRKAPNKSSKMKMTAESLKASRHLLVNLTSCLIDKENINCILKSVGPDFSENNVVFSGILPNTADASDVLESKGSSWDIYLIEEGSLPPKRICDALSDQRSPSFMRVITHGVVPRDEPKSLVQSEKACGAIESHCALLNSSQKAVVEEVLLGTKQVKTWTSWYVGTGKTRTIVSIIRALMDCGVRVHATAPTNAAMMVLAERTFDVCDFNADFPPSESKFRLANLLLVASERVNIGDKDKLNCLHEGPRLQRISRAAINVKYSYINKFSHCFYNSISDLEHNEVLENIKCDLNVLANEAPLCIIQNCRDSLRSLLLDIEHLLGVESIVLCSWQDDEDLSLKVTSIEIALKDIKNNMSSIPGNQLLQKQMFEEASVVFSTVNSGGKGVLREAAFDVVVVDEATQLTQAETAILFQGDMKGLILVGDEHQLPPTVFSPAGIKNGYRTSLFSRLVDLKYPVSMLDVQYRMHPQISEWSRTHIYKNNLSDGDNVKHEGYNRDFTSITDTDAALTVYDVSFGKEQKDSKGSSYNDAEVDVVRRLMTHVKKNLMKNLMGRDKEIIVVVLTPYASQCSRLKDVCKTFRSEKIQFMANTVDGFQGQECDIVIFSAVRSNEHGNLGFLADVQRMNVAITRPKHMFMLVCNTKTLVSNRNWCSYIGACNVVRDDRILRKVRKPWEEFNNRWDRGDALFKNCEWGVEYSNDFSKSMAAASSKTRADIIRVISRLASGQWPKHEKRRAFIPKKLIPFVHVYKYASGEYDLVWSVGVRQNIDGCGAQLIKMWGFGVYNRGEIERIILRIKNYASPLSPEDLRRCEGFCSENSKVLPKKFLL